MTSRNFAEAIIALRHNDASKKRIADFTQLISEEQGVERMMNLITETGSSKRSHHGNRDKSLLFPGSDYCKMFLNRCSDNRFQRTMLRILALLS